VVLAPASVAGQRALRVLTHPEARPLVSPLTHLNIQVFISVSCTYVLDKGRSSSPLRRNTSPLQSRCSEEHDQIMDITDNTALDLYEPSQYSKDHISLVDCLPNPRVSLVLANAGNEALVIYNKGYIEL